MRLLRQGGAQGRRAKARCGWPGIKKKEVRETETYRETQQGACERHTDSET